MKFTLFLVCASLLFNLGCVQKKKERDMSDLAGKDPHAGLDMDKLRSGDPHAGIQMSGGLDLEGMLAQLPEGWTKKEPSSSMRLAELSLAPAKGDQKPAELAVFHFPGSGGSSAANIQRWQNQFTGPNGEPGPSVAKTDTMMVGLLTVVTTDLTGTQIGTSAMMGEPDANIPDQRLIASVIETPSGNWFVKVVGPKNTVAAHEAKIRAFLRKAKAKGQ